MNQYLLEDQLGVVRVPYTREFAPKSATYGVTHPNGDTLIAAGTSHTLVKYALKAAAAEGATSFTVDWNSQARLQPGDAAFLAAASTPNFKPRETVKVYEVDGDTVYLTRKLEHAFAKSDYLWPAFFLVELSAANTATIERNCRVVLSVTLEDLSGGAAKVEAQQLYDVVAHVPVCPLDSAGLERFAPEVHAVLERTYRRSKEDIEDQIRTAWEVTLRETSPQVRPDLVLSDDQYIPVVLANLRLSLALRGLRPSDDVSLAEYKDAASEALEAATADFKRCVEALDVSQSGSVDDGETNRTAGFRYVRKP